MPVSIQSLPEEQGRKRQCFPLQHPFETVLKSFAQKRQASVVVSYPISLVPQQQSPQMGLACRQMLTNTSVPQVASLLLLWELRMDLDSEFSSSVCYGEEKSKYSLTTEPFFFPRLLKEFDKCQSCRCSSKRFTGCPSTCSSLVQKPVFDFYSSWCMTF